MSEEGETLVVICTYCTGDTYVCIAINVPELVEVTVFLFYISFNQLILFSIGLDGYAYAFRKKNVYKLNNAGLTPGYPRKTADVFPMAPGYPTAAFQIKALNHVYIIKGNQFETPHVQ